MFKVGDIVEYLGWEKSCFPDTRGAELEGRLKRKEKYVVTLSSHHYSGSNYYSRIKYENHSSAYWNLGDEALKKVGQLPAHINPDTVDLKTLSKYCGPKYKRNLPEWF